MEKAQLVLEDGTVFSGEAIGARGTSAGEVVFNTSMTGYEELLTDPSHRGQILTLTYPLIGSTGVTEVDSESDVPQVRGLVVRELSPQWDNWRGEGALGHFLQAHGVVGIHRIDTRALTRKLRDQGTMSGVISSEAFETDQLIQRARQAPDRAEVDLVSEVTVREPYEVSEPSEQGGTNQPHIVVIDFGVKRSLVKRLVGSGYRATVVPASYPAAEIERLGPDAVVLSNGPGDPRRVPYAVEAARDMLGHVPLFGISLGHQILALALGGATFKLKYGHRGANHPVQDVRTGKVAITSQSHGYAVDEESLDTDAVEVTHRSLNDGTVEGLRHRKLPIASVQVHPAAATGTQGVASVLDGFLENLSA